MRTFRNKKITLWKGKQLLYLELIVHGIFCSVVVVGGSMEWSIPSWYQSKSGTVSTADTVYWETKEVVTIHNVACLKWPRTRNGPERVRQPCFPKTHMEILASCINQLEGETRKFWWESVVVVHGKFCYKGFLRPRVATHGGKSLSERMWTDAHLCPMPKSTYW